MSMLKGLKKQAKKQGKKETTQKKVVKNQPKKVKQEEQEQSTDLVVINYDEKETTVAKNVNKKTLASKLEEKIIDTSAIVIENKQETKKVITTWVVNEDKVKDLLAEKYDAQKHDTEFISLTNQQINKQLEAKKKRQAEQKSSKTQDIQGGIRFARLETKDDGKEQNMTFKKKEQNSIINNIPVKQVKFFNPNLNTNAIFAPLEKTAQQIKQQQIERNLALRKQQQINTVKQSKGWMGKKSQPQQTQQQAGFKVSQWAVLGNQNNSNHVKGFAPLQKSEQQQKIEYVSQRKEQEMKFTSKKEIQERKKAREAKEALEAQKNKTAVTK